MAKNIVLCCDGTSNEYGYNLTNVVHLYATLVDDGKTQITYYHPGLGTMAPVGALSRFTRWALRKFGLAFGSGLFSDIADAYAFLMEHYEEGDKLFIFGFSRGAYTARSLAAVLHLYGLIRRGNEPLIPYATEMIGKFGPGGGGFYGNLDLAKGFKKTFSRECKPHFVGVWDTVSSVGWVYNPLSLPFTTNNPDIAVGRHAVSIDERRAFFRDNLWRSPTQGAHGPIDLKQVWFPGDHSDVGGGYPEKESGQSKFALEWMIVEARGQGMLTDQRKIDWVLGKATGSPFTAPNANTPLHDSLTWQWWLGEFVLRRRFDWKTGKSAWRWNLFGKRHIPDQPVPLIHASAQLRGTGYLKGLPPTYAIEPRISI